MPQPPSRRIKGKYRNNYSSERHGLSGALKWLWSSRGEYRQFKRVDFAKADNDPAFLKANRSEDTLTWVGHATFLIQLQGLNVLTDPVFSRRVSPFTFAGPERLAPLGLRLADLPAIDLVLISHNHYDHLDEAAVRALAKANPDTRFVVPLGLRRWFLARGISQVVELDWWQAADLAAAKVTALPAQHFSGRGAHDRNATLWCSLLLEVAGRKVYFAGDTGYSKDFADIGAAHPDIDLALLPIGAYEPNWFMKSVHVNPEEAVKIFQDLGARHAAAMHWGTFRLTLEPLDEPPQRLRKALAGEGIADERFFVMQHGESRRIQGLFSSELPASW